MKPIWKSKTFWANMIALATVIVADIEGYLKPEHYKYVVMGLGVANLILRYYTTEEVTLK